MIKNVGALVTSHIPFQHKRWRDDVDGSLWYYLCSSPC
jgi:hypothetical protein